MFSFLKKLGRNVLLLGIVSFLTDVGSEMIFSVLPLFLVNVLHAPMSVVGLVEGVAESTASLLKAPVGFYSDKIGKRKPFVYAGYAFSTFSKPLFALAGVWQHVLVVRFLDRVGKGLRSAPRDAIISASSGEKERGRAFGFHRALDTAGAVVGPLVAFLILHFYSSSLDLSSAYRTIFWLSFIPSALALLFIVPVKEKLVRRAKAVSFAALADFSSEFKRVLLVGVLFSLANFSSAFFILRSQDVGMAVEFVPLAYLFFNVVYAVSAFPFGVLADRLGKKNVLAFSFALFAFVCAGFALASSALAVWLLFGVYGLFNAAFETSQKAFVSTLAPGAKRASAMGAFQAAVGLVALPASIIAGLLWSVQVAGVSATFVFAVVFSLVSALLLATIRK
ncbi:MFS transporter [Candidatus Micrarchaeota archaeon]|nr:MFS transporter [Candidatus Micrarchaeota archaeon]